MSKRDIGKKLREEQEATAHAFQEFIQTFQGNAVAQCKTFVKSGLLHPNKGQEECEKGQLYIPKPLYKQDTNTVKTAIECARLVKDVKLERKNQQKPKSNLEMLKEELKLRHTARDEKCKNKDELANNLNECEGGDPSSTNLFLANLSQKMTENDLMLLCGAYGPLASVKIMWPRGDERGRNTNCGFVAFMSRKDAERALNVLKYRDDMRVGWGKCVEVPTHPIYIPPELIRFHLPPPYSGLPFNAQPNKQPFKEPTSEEEMNELLCNSIVKVTIPLNKRVLTVVNRMVEFVAREGPLFEAMIMNKELQNPIYQFLFDNKSPVHTYYRWKLYSILHGEGQKSWSNKSFRMFKGGSVWIPPTARDFTEGMPESLLLTSQKAEKALLSDSQMNRLMHYLQTMNTSRSSIAQVMIFSLNHKDAFADIMSVIADAFRNTATKATKKVARLYLVSDILYNCTVRNASKSDPNYNNALIEIKNYIIEIFENLRNTCENIKQNGDQEQFKLRVGKVLKSWDMWKLYPPEFLDKLENTFSPKDVKAATENDDDVFADEPLDGANLIKRSSESNPECVINKESKPLQKPKLDIAAFVPSRWEVVDPEEVEAQAMSTQKFYDMERKRKQEEKRSRDLDERERKKLRKIEVMVMEYREDLESGKKELKKGVSIEKEINNYRDNLMHKMKKDVHHIDNSFSPISSDSSPEIENRRSRKLKKELHSSKRRSSHKEKENYSSKRYSRK